MHQRIHNLSIFGKIFTCNLNPDPNIFRTNLLRTKKFWTLKIPDLLEFGKMNTSTVSRRSGDGIVTV